MAANTHFAVAVHALTVLAVHERLVTSEEVALSVQTNAVVARRILGKLTQADLVRSIPGKKGGFELARPAAEIDLAAVYRAVDAGATLKLPDKEPHQACYVSCGIKSVLQGLADRLDAVVDAELAGTTLADVVTQIPKT